jgi:hypothetical protein
MNKFIGSGLLVVGFMGANSVYADNYHHQSNNQMQHNEAQRIKQGVQSGSLTRQQASGNIYQEKHDAARVPSRY